MRPNLPVIVMSAQNTFMTAIRASERGAYEYLPKPFDLQGTDRRSSAARWRSRRSGWPITPTTPSSRSMPLVGRSPAMQEIYRVLARLMQTDLTVMISGESGTGKELVARALHDYGKRRNGPFVAVNMAAIPRDLIECELFGHETRRLHRRQHPRRRAASNRPRAARCFLTKSATCRWRRRPACLRVLQQGEYTTVGGRTPIKTDVRIVAATQQGSAHPDSAGAVPRGPVFPPQRRAVAASAATRTDRGFARPDPAFLLRSPKRTGCRRRSSTRWHWNG